LVQQEQALCEYRPHIIHPDLLSIQINVCSTKIEIVEYDMSNIIVREDEHAALCPVVRPEAWFFLARPEHVTARFLIEAQ
jgi:hypothetical protein